MDCVDTACNIFLSVCTFISVIYVYIQYKSYKKKEEYELFSDLNKRYQDNDDIQTVIKYLRDNEYEDVQPTVYQLEIFLRFFEELGMYMQSNSIDTLNVEKFFLYYLEKLYTSERGMRLLEKLNGEDNELTYLNTLKEKTRLKYLIK